MGEERREGISLDQLGYFVSALACLWFLVAMFVPYVWDMSYVAPGFAPLEGPTLMAQFGAGVWIMAALVIVGMVGFWWMSTKRGD